MLGSRRDRLETQGRTSFISASQDPNIAVFISDLLPVSRPRRRHVDLKSDALRRISKVANVEC